MAQAPKYTPQLRDKICARLAKGDSLRSICKDKDFPNRVTVHDWIMKNIGEVKNEEGEIIEEGMYYHYTRARQLGLDEMADEMLDIADDGTNDFVEVEMKKGGKRILADRELVQRSQLRVEARKWYLSKLAPRRYGHETTIMHQQLDKDGEKADHPLSGISDEIAEMISANVAYINASKKKKEDDS